MKKNSHIHFCKQYRSLLKKNYPSAAVFPLQRLPVSSIVISLPKAVVQQISALVKLLHSISQLETYRGLIQVESDDFHKSTHLASSLLMSYDFHWSEDQLRLIEVNTNAAGYLLSDLVDQAHGKETVALLSLKKSFELEWKKHLLGARRSKALQSSNMDAVESRRKDPLWGRFLIVDQEVKKQKMYREFLMYKDWVTSWGWPCQICEIGDLTLNKCGQLVDSHLTKVDMIYNRCTDFYFKDYPNIKKSFLNQTCCITPNPIDYLLLADKNRLCEWSSESFLNQLHLNPTDKQLIQQIIPFTNLVCREDSDYLWQNRKKFIFKPLRGYGGKAVYRGKNITKLKFKEIINNVNYIYQEYVPPGIWTDSEGKMWKYDIRAYVYQDQVQHLVARVYQGQVTSFMMEGSGFASVFIQ